MSKVRVGTVAGLLLVAISPLSSGAQASPGAATPDIKLIRLADNFHVIDESAAHGGSISVFTGEDGILMVDAGVAPLAAKAEAAIRQLSALPIRQLINTHVHVDETGGNEHFGKLGASIIARDEVRHGMLNPRPAASMTVQRDARQVRPPAPRLAVPTLTFDRQMSLHINGQEIRLIAMPPAHTNGDTLIHFPGLDIIVAGDVLRAHEFPSINRPSGGTLPGMLDALGMLIGLTGPGTRIITSHGQIVDRSVAIAQRDFLLLARDRIAEQIAQGKNLEQVIAADVVADQGIKALPGHISSQNFVRDVFEELTTK